MTFEWPDVELAVMDVLDELGETYLQLTVDWIEVLEGDPDPDATAIKIYAVGGFGGDNVTRTQRVLVEVYAKSRDRCQDVITAARNKLLSGPHDTSAGMIDRVRAEIEPARIAFTHQRIVQYQATFRADVRPIH